MSCKLELILYFIEYIGATNTCMNPTFRQINTSMHLHSDTKLVLTFILFSSECL